MANTPRATVTFGLHWTAVDSGEQMFDDRSHVLDLCHILWINPVEIPTSCAHRISQIGLG